MNHDTVQQRPKNKSQILAYERIRCNTNQHHFVVLLNVSLFNLMFITFLIYNQIFPFFSIFPFLILKLVELKLAIARFVFWVYKVA